MLTIISSITRLPYRPFVETIKYFSTSGSQLLPRRRRNDALAASGFNDPNPGIQKQLNSFKSEENFIEDTDDLEDMESDFMELGKMHRLHEKQQREHKVFVQRKMVLHKYFKPTKNPILLTWAEKEQIRYLHNSDPEKWNVGKLTQSFPASEEIVKKVLKSNWQPRGTDRIIKHDRMVQKNWELLRNGKLELSPELKEHIMQFTRRTIPANHQVPDVSVEEKLRPRPTKTEFGSIIESYKCLKGEEPPKSEVVYREQKDVVKPRDESYVLENESESYMKYGRSTLDRYRQRIETAIEKGHTPSPDARLMLKHSNNISVSNEIPNVDTLNVAVSKRSNVEIELENDDNPPEWIRIPRNKWKRGATFKMGDCYYDDDGSFLYRVPGMK